MIREEILEKLTNELSSFIYEVEYPRELIRTYLNYALDIGTFHLYRDAKEVAKLDIFGNIIKKYRSTSEAAEKNNINEGNIKAVLANRRNMAGGFLWKRLTA